MGAEQLEKRGSTISREKDDSGSEGSRWVGSKGDSGSLGKWRTRDGGIRRWEKESAKVWGSQKRFLFLVITVDPQTISLNNDFCPHEYARLKCPTKVIPYLSIKRYKQGVIWTQYKILEVL